MHDLIYRNMDACHPRTRTTLCDCNCRSIYQLPELNQDLTNADMIALYHNGETFKYSMFNLVKWVKNLIGVGDGSSNGSGSGNLSEIESSINNLLLNITDINNQINSLNNSINNINNSVSSVENDVNNINNTLSSEENSYVGITCGKNFAGGIPVKIPAGSQGYDTIDVWSHNHTLYFIKDCKISKKISVPMEQDQFINLTGSDNNLFFVYGDADIYVDGNAGSVSVPIYSLYGGTNMYWDNGGFNTGSSWMPHSPIHGGHLTYVTINYDANNTGVQRHGQIRIQPTYIPNSGLIDLWITLYQDPL